MKYKVTHVCVYSKGLFGVDYTVWHMLQNHVTSTPHRTPALQTARAGYTLLSQCGLILQGYWRGSLAGKRVGYNLS